jgi:DNA end-binding protein Ku
MTARAIWKATVEFGDIEIPIKLYSAIQDSTVHFRLLDDRNQEPVKQKMVESGADIVAGNEPDVDVEDAPSSSRFARAPEVPAQEIRKGAPVGPGRFVVLTDEELASIEPKESRSIEVFRFIPTAALDHAYYNRAYWLGPDGESGAYWALVEALTEQKREGLTRWVMRKRAYVGALRVRGDHLMLITLRHIGEVVSPKELRPSGGKTPDPRELEMARQLVGMLEDTFDPRAYHDEYRDRVLELIERKKRGQTIAAVKPKAKPATSSLVQALEKSIAAAGGTPRTRRTRRAAHG